MELINTQESDNIYMENWVKVRSGSIRSGTTAREIVAETETLGPDRQTDRTELEDCRHFM